jgi:ABC-2 type transport system ATP-binding protein
MIEINQVGFAYGREELFRGLNLTLAPGNIYGLLGMNGAGKTTLLRLMSGLLFTEAGSVRAFGSDPARRDPSFLANVFALPEELNLPTATDREYLAMRAPFYPNFDYARFERYTQELEIPRGRRLTTLSYGQKKKFLLSFGLACQSALLIMDEPTNGLDIPSKGQFRRLVAEALTPERIFVISTHQVQDVAALIDPVVILHGGRVLLNHTTGEIAARVRMTHTPTRPDPNAAGLLHTEPALGGFWSVWRDAGAGDGQIDLEVLFNTVVSQPAVVAELLNSKEAQS